MQKSRNVVEAAVARYRNDAEWAGVGEELSHLGSKLDFRSGLVARDHTEPVCDRIGMEVLSGSQGCVARGDHADNGDKNQRQSDTQNARRHDTRPSSRQEPELLERRAPQPSSMWTGNA